MRARMRHGFQQRGSMFLSFPRALLPTNSAETSRIFEDPILLLLLLLVLVLVIVLVLVLKSRRVTRFGRSPGRERRRSGNGSYVPATVISGRGATANPCDTGILPVRILRLPAGGRTGILPNERGTGAGCPTGCRGWKHPATHRLEARCHMKWRSHPPEERSPAVPG